MISSAICPLFLVFVFIGCMAVSSILLISDVLIPPSLDVYVIGGAPASGVKQTAFWPALPFIGFVLHDLFLLIFPLGTWSCLAKIELVCTNDVGSMTANWSR